MDLSQNKINIPETLERIWGARFGPSWTKFYTPVNMVSCLYSIFLLAFVFMWFGPSWTISYTVHMVSCLFSNVHLITIPTKVVTIVKFFKKPHVVYMRFNVCFGLGVSRNGPFFVCFYSYLYLFFNYWSCLFLEFRVRNYGFGLGLLFRIRFWVFNSWFGLGLLFNNLFKNKPLAWNWFVQTIHLSRY